MRNFDRSARSAWNNTNIAALCCVVVCVGCASWVGREPIIENQFVTYYNKLATEAAALDPSIQSFAPAPSLGEGRQLTAIKSENRWPITLEEAIRIGLENNTIVRQNAQFMSPNDPVMQNPDAAPSRYDPDIQINGILFGSRGVFSAISDFDPRYTSSMKWERSANVQNSLSLAPPNNTLVSEGAEYQSRLDQQFINGGLFSVINNWTYAQTNQPENLFASTYTGTLGAEFRQPLWSGFGKQFNLVAGPLAQRARGFSNVSQGVVIAHINKRIADIDLLENLQNYVREVGDLYWDLYQNYQDYDYAKESTDVAHKLWERLKLRAGLDPGADVAQAEDAYWESKAKEEQALSTLFLTEANLRRLLTLPIDDNRVLYPFDEPRKDKVVLNRAVCLLEALTNRPELTRQKSNIHSLELQLTAAKNLVAPRFDFVGSYGNNGFGDKLWAGSSADVQNTNNGYNSAITSLLRGQQTSWQYGFEYSQPLWFRQEKAQVHQLEFRLLKARAVLATQEDDIARQLNTVMLRIQRGYSTAEDYRKAVIAAQNRVRLTQYERDFDTIKSTDLFLRAQARLTEARAAYARSVADYNKSLREMLYRMGRLLNADGVSILGVDGLPVIPEPTFETPTEDKSVPPEPESEPPEPDPEQKPKKNRVAGSRPEVSSAPVKLQNIETTDDWQVPPAPSDRDIRSAVNQANQKVKDDWNAKKSDDIPPMPADFDDVVIPASSNESRDSDSSDNSDEPDFTESPDP